MMLMTTKNAPITARQRASFTARKVISLADTLHEAVPDSLAAWMARYLTFAEKITLHLDRFLPFFTASYAHDRACRRRPQLDGRFRPRHSPRCEGRGGRAVPEPAGVAAMATDTTGVFGAVVPVALSSRVGAVISTPCISTRRLY